MLQTLFNSIARLLTLNCLSRDAVHEEKESEWDEQQQRNRNGKTLLVWLPKTRLDSALLHLMQVFHSSWQNEISCCIISSYSSLLCSSGSGLLTEDETMLSEGRCTYYGRSEWNYSELNGTAHKLHFHFAISGFSWTNYLTATIIMNAERNLIFIHKYFFHFLLLLLSTS